MAECGGCVSSGFLSFFDNKPSGCFGEYLVTGRVLADADGSCECVDHDPLPLCIETVAPNVVLYGAFSIFSGNTCDFYIGCVGESGCTIVDVIPSGQTEGHLFESTAIVLECSGADQAVCFLYTGVGQSGAPCPPESERVGGYFMFASASPCSGDCGNIINP